MAKTSKVTSFTFNRIRNTILFTSLKRNSINWIFDRISFRIINKITLIRTPIQRYQTRLSICVNSPETGGSNHHKFFLQIFIWSEHNFRKIFIQIFLELLFIWYLDHRDSLPCIIFIILEGCNIKSWGGNIFYCMH